MIYKLKVPKALRGRCPKMFFESSYQGRVVVQNEIAATDNPRMKDHLILLGYELLSVEKPIKEEILEDITSEKVEEDTTSEKEIKEEPFKKKIKRKSYYKPKKKK